MEYRYREQKELIKGELGNIPKSWNQAKAQYYFDVFAGGTPSTNEPKYWDGDIPWINSGEVQNCYITNVSRYITNQGLKESSTKLIPKNTTVLAMTGATCGNVGYLQFDSTANQSVMAFVPKYSYNSKFLYYYLMCQSQQIEYYKTGGAQGGINVDNGKKLYINIPLDEEQEKIANFLDKKTSKFNSIISKKEALIEKLEEAKKSLISEVVTGKMKVIKNDDGYDLVKRSNDEMKDSGVEWLGEIPKDWEVNKLSNIAELTRLAGAEYTSYWETDDDGEIIALRGQNIGINELNLNNIERISSKLSNRLNRSKLYKGDIVFPCVGSIGKASLIKEDNKYHINQNIAKITHNDKIVPELLSYLLNSNECHKQITWFNSSQMQPSVLIRDLRQFKFALSYDKLEQVEICEFLELKLHYMNKILNNTKNQIQKLKEAKQSLISEAVTGKIEILD